MEVGEPFVISISQSGEEILDQTLPVTGVRAERRGPARRSQCGGR